MKQVESCGDKATSSSCLRKAPSKNQSNGGNLPLTRDRHFEAWNEVSSSNHPNLPCTASCFDAFSPCRRCQIRRGVCWTACTYSSFLYSETHYKAWAILCFCVWPGPRKAGTISHAIDNTLPFKSRLYGMIPSSLGSCSELSTIDSKTLQCGATIHEVRVAWSRRARLMRRFWINDIIFGRLHRSAVH